MFQRSLWQKVTNDSCYEVKLKLIHSDGQLALTRAFRSEALYTLVSLLEESVAYLERAGFRQSYLNLWAYKIRNCSTLSGEKNESDFKLIMKSVNEVKLLGHVGIDPKKYETKNGLFVTYFRMATSRCYYDKSETRHSITNWHAIIVRRPSLQDYVIKYVSKGGRVYISGYLDDFNYDFNDESQVRGPVHVVAEEVIFLKKSQFSQQENSPFFYGIGGDSRTY